MSTVRIAHVSDIHVTAPKVGWRREDWFNKRLSAYLNLRWLGRGYRFRHADQVLAALMDELRQRRPDRVVFSGDATALGFEEEMHRASGLLGLHNGDALPGIAVPGNHDYCTPTAASGLFERHFSPWQQGERVDSSIYPFAQRVGHVWVIAVNSSTPNFWPWDASGEVGPAQAARLRELLHQLDNSPRILVTHYPVCLRNGKLESRTHRLRDVREVTTLARDEGLSLWLHGHRHDSYYLPKTEWTPFPVICCGSTTQSSLWSYGEYTIEDRQFRAVRRAYDPESNQFRDAEMFELTLP